MLYVTDIVDTGHGLSLDDLERLKVKGHKRDGNGDRHVGIYASPDNWRTCYPHMPIGTLWIYRLLFVFLCVCLSAGFFVRDILGVGWRRAMKFCRMVELAVQQVISPFGELWPKG